MRGRQQTLTSGAEGVAESDLSGIGSSGSSSKTNRISASNKTEYSPIRSPAISIGQPTLAAGQKTTMLSTTPTTATTSRGTPSSSRGSTSTASQNRSGKGPGNPGVSGGGPGRTPQTRRKELSLQQQQQQPLFADSRSPVSSPRTTGSTRVFANLGSSASSSSSPTPTSTSAQQNKKSRRSQDPEAPVRKTSTSSLTKEPSNSRSSSRKSPLHPSIQNLRVSPQISVDSDGNDRSLKIRREKTKFDELWDCKTIEHGLIRIPTQRLEDLISKERIEKVYEVDEKPVAR